MVGRCVWCLAKVVVGGVVVGARGATMLLVCGSMDRRVPPAEPRMRYCLLQFAQLESDCTFGSTFFAHSGIFQLCNNSLWFCIHFRVDTCAGAPPGAANRTPKYASSYCNLYNLKMFAHSGAHSWHIQGTFGHIRAHSNEHGF